ncbi:MAG TPA: hypothetical protein VF260_12160 [Bacilli bacterium]
MHLICSYPIQEAAVLPHCGKQVAVVLADGDVACGVIDGVRDGNLLLRPAAGVDITAIRNKLLAHPKVKAAMQKADTKAFFPFFNPFLWAIPLFLIAALFAFPFFWL